MIGRQNRCANHRLRQLQRAIEIARYDESHAIASRHRSLRRSEHDARRDLQLVHRGFDTADLIDAEALAAWSPDDAAHGASRGRRSRDWEAHREALFADLKPVGYLETALADRITLYFWRLGRVARHEREVVAIRQESLAEEIAASRREKAKINRLCRDSPMLAFGVGDDMHPDEVISRPGKAKRDLALLEGFPKVPDNAELGSGRF